MNKSALFQRRNALRLGIALGVLIVVAVALGWSAGYTPSPPPPPKTERAWSLPQLKTEDSAKDLAVLTARKPWGNAGAPAATMARIRSAQTVWRLAGVVQRGDESLVLIASGPPNAPKFDYFRVGDKLPDGGVLVEISAEGAVVQGPSSDEKVAYPLFGH